MSEINYCTDEVSRSNGKALASRWNAGVQRLGRKIGLCISLLFVANFYLPKTEIVAR